jgi:hypothetical protein
MEGFKKATKAEIVNAIFLTDGDANTVNGYYDANQKHQSLNYGVDYVIEDRHTHKTYKFDRGRMTPMMLQILRDRQNINAVGFFVDGSWEQFFHNIDDLKRKELNRQFNEDGYVIAEGWGYNELYITKPGSLNVSQKTIKPKSQLGTEAYETEIGELFTKSRKAVLKQRLMLDRFVKMIA